MKISSQNINKKSPTQQDVDEFVIVSKISKNINGKTNNVTPPLFKFDVTSKEQMNSVAVVIAGVSVIAGLYILGVVLSKAILTMISFVLAVIFVVGIFVFKKKTNKELEKQREKVIDETVDKYKQDLVNTMVGYDIEYRDEDIINSSNHYREIVEENNLDLTDLDIKEMGKVIIDTIKK